MSRNLQRLTRIDRSVVSWLSAHSVTSLRLATAAVFLWFGGLKFFPHRSPAEQLSVQTVGKLSHGAIGPSTARRCVATLECAIGLGLIVGRPMRPTLLLLALQMAGALSPIVLFPRRLFRRPWQPTLEGQYVIKDLVIVAAGMVLGANVRGDSRRSAP